MDPGVRLLSHGKYLIKPVPNYLFLSSKDGTHAVNMYTSADGCGESMYSMRHLPATRFIDVVPKLRRRLVDSKLFCLGYVPGQNVLSKFILNRRGCRINTPTLGVPARTYSVDIRDEHVTEFHNFTFLSWTFAWRF